MLTENIFFRNCASVVAGPTPVVFDCNGTIAPIHFRGWHGGLKITNFTGGGNMSIDVSTGTVEIDSTCTAGTIVVRGEAHVTDTSGVGCTVINRTNHKHFDEITAFSKKASDNALSANLKL